MCAVGEVGEVVVRAAGLAEGYRGDPEKTKEKFVNNLKKNGAEFPPTLVDSLDRLILTMHPKYKRKAAEKQMNGEAGNNASEKSRMFPGLAIPDQQWQAARPDTKDEKNATEKEVDDLLSQLEGVAAKKSRPPDAMDLEEPPVKRQRRDDDRDGRRRQAPAVVYIQASDG